MSAVCAFLALSVLTFFAVLPAQAQAQSTAEPALALRGMNVVSSLQPSGPVKGQAAVGHDIDGARCLFTSAQNRVAFVPDPDTDTDTHPPQFAGLCTSGPSKGFIGDSDPAVWKIVDGRLYLFSTAEPMPAAMSADQCR